MGFRPPMKDCQKWAPGSSRQSAYGGLCARAPGCSRITMEVSYISFKKQQAVHRELSCMGSRVQQAVHGGLSCMSSRQYAAGWPCRIAFMSSRQQKAAHREMLRLGSRVQQVIHGGLSCMSSRKHPCMSSRWEQAIHRLSCKGSGQQQAVHRELSCMGSGFSRQSMEGCHAWAHTTSSLLGATAELSGIAHQTFQIALWKQCWKT
jgi:hypothetical protein